MPRIHWPCSVVQHRNNRKVLWEASPLVEKKWNYFANLNLITTLWIWTNVSYIYISSGLYNTLGCADKLKTVRWMFASVAPKYHHIPLIFSRVRSQIGVSSVDVEFLKAEKMEGRNRQRRLDLVSETTVFMLKTRQRNPAWWYVYSIKHKYTNCNILM